jgi:ATP-dependent Lon protease
MLTRAKEKKMNTIPENAEAEPEEVVSGETDEEKKVKQKTRKNTNRKSSCLILKVQKPSNGKKHKQLNEKDNDKTEEDVDDDIGSDTSGSDDDDDDDEEEFMLPEVITRDARLNKKAIKIMDHIQKNTLTLQHILESPIRMKHRAELFELFFIYDNTMPNTEERMELRKILYKMYTDYISEHEKYLQNKSAIRVIEKQQKSSSSILDLQYDILRLQTNDKNKEVMMYKYLELKEKTEQDEEYYKLKKWLRHALDLPFDRIKEYPQFQEKDGRLTELLTRMKKSLDEELFGMKRVKEQILLFLHNKLLFPTMTGCCMGLVGPPGVGKTTIARCLAKIMDFPFQQISFGGVHNSESLKGFDYTYVGSQPGEIVRCLTRMKYKNGILFFDEYEKISQNNDIVSFLLHLTDFSQNSEYRDNYLNDITIDLSAMWFIYSMNELPQDKALQDRIFIIQVDGYSTDEKIRIILDFLFPRHLATQNLKKDDIVVSEDVARHIIARCSQESDKGIRNIERAVKDIIHKISFIVEHKTSISMSFIGKEGLSYPVQLTRERVDVLLKDFDKKSDTNFMYI